jgi:hypothetical protein
MTNHSMPVRRFHRPHSLAGKSTFAVVLLVCAIVIAYFVATNAMAKRLEVAWKLSEEFGLPRNLDGLFGEKIPDRENAAYPMETAASIASRFLTAERNRLNNPQDDVLIGDQSYLAAMDRLLVEPEYESSLAEADRRPGYHSLDAFGTPLFTTLLTHLNAQRELVRAEQAIARRLTSLDKREEAVRRLLRMTRLTRRWEDKEPFLIAALKNILLRSAIMEELNGVLRHGGPLPAGLHDEIEYEFALTENALLILPRVAEAEKLMIVEAREKYPLPGSRIVNRLARDDDLAFMIRQIHGVAGTYDRPYYLAKPEIVAIESDFMELFNDPVRKWMHAGAQFLSPAISIGRRQIDRLIALSRCLRIVNAMARKNDFAAGFDSLGLPKEVFIDPFDGKTMRIKKTPNGPLVYSIGGDLYVLGGAPKATKGFGLGPPETKPVTK